MVFGHSFTYLRGIQSSCSDSEVWYHIFISVYVPGENSPKDVIGPDLRPEVQPGNAVLVCHSKLNLSITTNAFHAPLKISY